jgi:hypothetical protein
MIPPIVAVACSLAVAVAEVRDPFSPPPPPPRADGATPLQRLEVDQLRLVALVYAPVSRALLEDAAGIGHVAVVGTPIGPRGGTVIGIAPGALRIHEPGTGDIVLELRVAPGSGR